MRANIGGTNRAQFLSGWKEIANYLDKGVRTVQRYERQLGLPVRRPAGKPQGTVIATTSELDAWIMASPIRDAFRLNSQPSGRVAASTASLRSGIAEMDRLREQMTVLREEISASVQLLSNVLSEIRDDLQRDALRDSRRKFSVLEPKHRSSQMLELLEINPRRNAS